MDVRIGPPYNMRANCDTLSVQPFRPRLYGAVRTHMIRRDASTLHQTLKNALLSWLEAISFEPPLAVMNKRESEGQVVGSGAFSKVWMAYINHDTLESMIQEAFGSLGSLPNRGQDEWASWCKVSDVQEQLRARQVGQKRARLVDLYRPSTLTRRILGTADESDMAQPAQTPYEV